ncbi:hypothetical protein [Immundisolibacter sp.]|nr:hypothetical protein [Immundisolibacter sp.]MDD3651969.1 hypothetical protein [Immundisolibacter sp.]
MSQALAAMGAPHLLHHGRPMVDLAVGRASALAAFAQTRRAQLTVR